MHTLNADIRTLSVAQTDPLLRDAAVSRLQRRIRDLLAFFVPEPASFSSVLAETGSLVTGEATLWFMLCGDQCPEPSSLKVVCCRDNFDYVLRHLSKIPGSSVSESPLGRDLYPPIRATTFGTLSHMLVRTRQGLIEVLQSDCNTAFHPIPFLRATHLMNVLSPVFFISPYPRLICSRTCIVTSASTCPDVEGDSPWLQHLRFTRLSDRNEVCDLSRTCYNFSACSKRVRCFADDDCLTVSIGPASPPQFTIHIWTQHAQRGG